MKQWVTVWLVWLMWAVGVSGCGAVSDNRLDAATDGSVSDSSASGAVVIEQPANQSAPMNEPFSLEIAATSTEPIAFTLVAGALPDGLSLDPDTGEIQGTPTRAALLGGSPMGKYELVVRASNSAGTADTDPFEIDVLGVSLPTPVLYWSYDDADITDLVKLEDGTENDHDGLFIGSPTTGQESLAGQAFSFDGSADLLQATGVPPPADDYSMVAAGRPSAVGDSKRVLAQYGMSDPSPTYRGTMLQMMETGLVRASFEDGSDVIAESTTALAVGEWTPVGMTWEQAVGRGRIYVNGVEEGSITGGQVLFATDNFETGRHPQFDARYWSGELDEVALWHVHLDGDQMATVTWLFWRGVSIKSWVGL